LPAAFHLAGGEKIRFTGHCSERDVAGLVQASGARSGRRRTFLPAAFHLAGGEKIRFTGHCSERDVAGLVQASG
ncbi:oxidoreductase, partial [Klebsiella pneumoniae]